MVSPSIRRRAATSVVEAGLCSTRRACRYLSLGRSSLAYRPKPPSARAEQLRSALVRLSHAYPRYGYRRIQVMLEREGFRCSWRTVQRLRRQEGLGVKAKPRRPKCPPRPDAKIKAEGLNDVWCVDLVFDRTVQGTSVKLLTILDEGAHYCVDIVAGRRMGGRDVVQALRLAMEQHGVPRHLRSDNGGEFIAASVAKLRTETGISARFIEPGCPWQNGINESFNGRFRDECLNREVFTSVLEAQVLARQFRDEYNDIRPHSSIGYQTPSAYRRELIRQAPGLRSDCRASPTAGRELAASPNPCQPSPITQTNPS